MPKSEKVKMALSLELSGIFCVNIDIDKIYPKSMRTDIFIGRGFAELQILKK